VITVRIYLTTAIGVMGFVVGYLAQRSRMCFIAGFRDYLLVRDRELLLGFFSFFLTIWLLTTVFYSLNLLKKGAPEYGEPATGGVIENGPAAAIGSGASEAVVSGPAVVDSEPRDGRVAFAVHGPRSVRFLSAPFIPDRFVFLSLAGGWFVGLLSTFAGGCVLRQHILAAQGGRDASWYLAGFYTAVPVFYLLLSRLVNSIY
jgi:hypothetical protein